VGSPKGHRLSRLDGSVDWPCASCRRRDRGGRDGWDVLGAGWGFSWVGAVFQQSQGSQRSRPPLGLWSRKLGLGLWCRPDRPTAQEQQGTALRHCGSASFVPEAGGGLFRAHRVDEPVGENLPESDGCVRHERNTKLAKDGDRSAITCSFIHEDACGRVGVVVAGNPGPRESNETKLRPSPPRDTA